MQKVEIVIEVAYALPHLQLIVVTKVPEGATAKLAIETSGILSKFPEMNLDVNKIGIFGKLSKLDTILKHMDRVEIYRTLFADPKEIRQKRAQKMKNK